MRTRGAGIAVVLLTSLVGAPGPRPLAPAGAASGRIALYEGQRALIHLSRSHLPRDRAIYSRLVQALTLSDSTASH